MASLSFALVGLVLFNACFNPVNMAPGKDKEDQLLARLQEFLDEKEQEKAQANEVASPAQYQLHIDETEFKIEGYLEASDESGGEIVFSVEDFDYGNGKLLITDGQGDVIMYVLRTHRNLILVTIRDVTLFYIRSTNSIYEVSSSQFIAAQKIVEEGTQARADMLAAKLVPITDAQALGYMASLTPYTAIFDEGFAKLLSGDFSGTSSPAVQVFANFARSMSAKSTTATARNRQMRTANNFWAHSSQETEMCTAYPTTCPVGKCPGEECRGICGVGCECWESICGDCCKHSACLGVGNCCRNTADFYSQLRCLVPFGFRCDNTFTC